MSHLTRLVAQADAILILSGAGISTASGIPDFRGPNGIWKTERPVPFDEFLTNEQRRIASWEQKVRAAEVLRDARPNAVHVACVELEASGKLEMVATQNIDGLHAEAGTSPGRLVELHGTGREAGCLSCGERTPIEPHLERFVATGTAPTCAACGGLLKSATISFGQALDPLVLDRAHRAAERCDLVVALGTSLSVYPAADLPLTAVRRGIPYAIVNRGGTDHDTWTGVTVRIDGDVNEVFPQVVAAAIG